ncbi:hypothetical protein [Streptomyces sp. enrichment culture]|uniref:hypothetical protein n=1 Tax=Streptomyces sp. enrichment culture TaxID=1795815 RepID=UPI003F568B66
MVDDLDDTIKIIRSSTPCASTISPVAEADRAPSWPRPPNGPPKLGYPALRITGLLNTAVSADQTEQRPAVLGEALSGAAWQTRAPTRSATPSRSPQPG